MKRKQNKAQTTDSNSSANTIPYDQAVAEGKDIVAEEKRGQLRLGQLAHNVEKKYGDRTLAKFAKEIGISPCTLERHQSVYRAWKEKPAPGPVCYAVLRALQDHPDRYNIVKENPNLTQAKARDKMRDYKDAGKEKVAGKKKGSADWDRHAKRWFKNVLTLANDAIRTAEVARQCSTPEQRDNLLMAVDPHLVADVREGGKALVELADWLEERLEEASAKVIREGRVKTSPKPAHVMA
jgi:hypothetical protein